MRTREEQIAELAGLCEDAGIFASGAAHERAEEILSEAEQRIRAEIGRDSERLDWLEKQPKSVMSYEERSRILFYSPELCPWDDIRDAIDAAREVGAITGS